VVDNNLAKVRANQIRNQYALGLGPVADVFSFLEDVGIFVWKEPLVTVGVSALFMKDKKNHLVLINSNRTLGHQIFSAAHELYHYFFNSELLGGVCTIFERKNDIEIMADTFAANFLMPEEGILNYVTKRRGNKKKLEINDLIYIQQFFKVSWAALLRRLLELNHIDNREYDYYRTVPIISETRKLGYPTNLLEKTCDRRVSRTYIEYVVKGYENDEISLKKAEEYLADVGIGIQDIFSRDELFGRFEGGDEC